jgi:YgiT-type zinc finger domain-containing protein
MGSRFQKEEEIVKCVICKRGETKDGTATVTLDKNGTTLVFKGVPARICSNCGEEYVDENIVTVLLRSADQAARSGIQVEVRQYIGP